LDTEARDGEATAGNGLVEGDAPTEDGVAAKGGGCGVGAEGGSFCVAAGIAGAIDGGGGGAMAGD